MQKQTRTRLVALALMPVVALMTLVSRTCRSDGSGRFASDRVDPESNRFAQQKAHAYATGNGELWEEKFEK